MASRPRLAERACDVQRADQGMASGLTETGSRSSSEAKKRRALTRCLHGERALVRDAEGCVELGCVA